MDQETAVMTFIIIAICTLPFAWLYYAGIKRRNSLKNKLSDLAKAHNCNITRFQSEAGIAMGLDEQSNQLFYSIAYEHKSAQGHIDLTTKSHCTALRSIQVKGKGKDKHEVIEQLGLVFKSANTKIPDETIVLYDADDSAHLGSQLQVMEQWHDLIQGRLKTKTIAPEAAIVMAV